MTWDAIGEGQPEWHGLASILKDWPSGSVKCYRGKSKGTSSHCHTSKRHHDSDHDGGGRVVRSSSFRMYLEDRIPRIC